METVLPPKMVLHRMINSRRIPVHLLLCNPTPSRGSSATVEFLQSIYWQSISTVCIPIRWMHSFLATDLWMHNGGSDLRPGDTKVWSVNRLTDCFSSGQESVWRSFILFSLQVGPALSEFICLNGNGLYAFIQGVLKTTSQSNPCCAILLA